MTYTLKVSEELLRALNAAGREEVRGVLSRHFGVEHVERGRGRPRKGTSFSKKGTPIQKKEPVINNGDSLKEMGSVSVKGDPIKEIEPVLESGTPLEKGNPVPPWKAKLEADRERIAREKALRASAKNDPAAEPMPDDAPGVFDEEF